MPEGAGAIPFRPALRWHGGKWRLAPWILSYLPPHRTYVEPFGGAASILLRKRRSYAEVYNDLDGEVVNLFRVLRGPDAAGLIAGVRLTPFARAEFDLAYQPAVDPIERARRLVVRSFQGFGSTGNNIAARTGFRSNAYASNTHPASDFAGLPKALAVIAERLRGVVIEQRPAIDVMLQHDGPETLHYVDPPYLHGTRSGKVKRGGLAHAYAHEMTDEDHAKLLAQLLQLSGMVALSGYPSEIYTRHLIGWRRVERTARDTRTRERTEVLWLNPAASAATGGRLPLLEPSDA